MTARSQSKIYFFFQKRIALNQRTQLKKFIEELFKKERKKLDNLNFIFCSDEELLQINRQYLEHDYYTDIITFGLSGAQEPVSGEIYISVDRIRENANIQATSISRELHRVIFHGCLHLSGFSDKTQAEKHIMTQKEDYYLGQYFKPRST